LSILVTGASGFVGLNVVEHLLERGQTVVAFADRPPPDLAARDFARFGAAYRPLIGDVRDEVEVRRALDANQVDRVMHAAAVTSAAQRERTEGARTLDVNLVGLAATASAAAQHGVARFVMIGSNAIFGGDTPDGATLAEDAPKNPGNLYALSKWTGEMVLAHYGRSSGLDWTVGRLAGVFGPWEYRTGIRDTMNPVFQSTAVAVAGGAAALPRPGASNWHFARDAAAALAMLLLAPTHRHNIYNLGTPFVWSIGDWCALLEPRFPGFAYTIGKGGGVPIDLYADHDGAILSGARFADEFGPTGTNDLDQAFAIYMDWLEGHDFFGVATRGAK